MKGVDCSSDSTTAQSRGGGGGSFYKFLKPGALAKLRDSRVAARFQKHHHISLCDLLLSAASNDDDVPYRTDLIPCFSVRIGTRPRCLLTKKLIAVSPVFADSDQ